MELLFALNLFVISHSEDMALWALVEQEFTSVEACMQAGYDEAVELSLTFESDGLEIAGIFCEPLVGNGT